MDTEDTMNQQNLDEMTHSWKPHEVFIINSVCDATDLIASLYDTDIRDPVASFETKDSDEAILSVARYSDNIYRLIDSNGDLVKEGESLPDVLLDVKNAGIVAKALAILPCGTHFLRR